MDRDYLEKQLAETNIALGEFRVTEDKRSLIEGFTPSELERILKCYKKSLKKQLRKNK